MPVMIKLYCAHTTRGGTVKVTTPKTGASCRAGTDPEVEDLTDYCSRPSCRKEFRRTVGPGRRQAYCSEICRRTAEKELRRARARLAHYEELVQKLRIDVAAYGRLDGVEQGSDVNSSLQQD